MVSNLFVLMDIIETTSQESNNKIRAVVLTIPVMDAKRVMRPPASRDGSHDTAVAIILICVC